MWGTGGQALRPSSLFPDVLSGSSVRISGAGLICECYDSKVERKSDFYGTCELVGATDKPETNLTLNKG